MLIVGAYIAAKIMQIKKTAKQRYLKHLYFAVYSPYFLFLLARCCRYLAFCIAEPLP